jgi:hypothetical protein
MMHRPQFSIRTLIWLALIVAAFLPGIAFERVRRESIEFVEKKSPEFVPDSP